MLNRQMRRAAKAVGLVGATPKESRKPEEVRKDYAQACAAAGELQYKLVEFQTELNRINESIRSLNQEFATIPKEESKEETK